MKKKCLLYGNCQVNPLKKLLERHPDFYNNYEIITIQCFDLCQGDISHLEKLVRKSDLFIHQIVSPTYKGTPEFSTNYLKSLVKPDTKVISFPVAFFTGYQPQMVYLKVPDKEEIAESPFVYHDRNILLHFVRGETAEETANKIESQDLYSVAYVIENLKNTLLELKKREASIDIKISEFIQENYRKARLFHTINHPGCIVMAHIAKLILDHLEMPSERDCLANFYISEMLDYVRFPIYTSVAQNLTLQFSCTQEYYYRHETFSLKQAIEKFFKYYDSNPDIVKFNLPKLFDFPKQKKATEQDLDSCYKILLNRKPDQLGREYWMNKIYQEAMTIDSLIKAFLGSLEFKKTFYNFNYFYDDIVDKEDMQLYLSQCYRLFWRQELTSEDWTYWQQQFRDKNFKKRDLLLAIWNERGLREH